jgi:ferritin-like metal-binding protein YciE
MAKKPKMLDELFHDTLKDIYFAEKKILAALPKMAKAAQNADLKAAFEKHAGEADGAKEFIASGCPLGSLPSTCPGLEGRE